MEEPSTGTHQETSRFANVWKGTEDEDYKMFLDLQMDDSGADMDPLYETFLDHLREDSHSYILEMIDGDHGLPAFVNYGEEDASSEDINKEPQRSSQNVSDKTKTGCPEKLTHLNGIRSHESVEIGASPLDSKSRLKTSCSLIDESYEIFLRNVRFEDFLMVLEWESTVIRYEGLNGAGNASGLSTENTQSNAEQGLVPYRSSHCESHVSQVDDNPTVTIQFNDPSQFRRQLNAVLSKPFDRNEYEELLKEATDRKPLKKQKHLRGMSKSYATKLQGMSYLDHHPDLAKQLESADCHKGLDLLRGFFFWLKNLCHEGAFMPWLPVPCISDALVTTGYELMLPLNDLGGDDIQGMLPSPPCVEDAMGESETVVIT